MAESTPLLSHFNSPPESKCPSLNEATEECIADFGFAQFVQTVLVSFAWVFDAQQTFISVFAEAEPSWRCTDHLRNGSCDSLFFNICQLPKDSWAWDRPIHSSIVSEWELQCSSALIKGLPVSSFFMGCLVGGLVLATLAHSSLGRKNLLFLSCPLMSFSSLFTVFTPNIWIYSASKFLNGFGHATIGTCALVLSTELVGKRWRGQVGILGFLCFTLGFLFFLENSLCTSIPTIFYCILIHFLVRESPRWLLVRGHKDEAISILTIISATKNSLITKNLSDMELEQEQAPQNDDIYSTIKILLEKNWAFRRLSAVTVRGFGSGLVYYGMPLGLANLDFNLYLSVTFNALSELQASLITFFFIDKLNRKCSLPVLTGLSGICSILCVVMGKISGNLQIGLEMISFFSACTGFSILLIYTIELFPTSVRNSAISMVRQALVFGGMFSPLLVAAESKSGFLSYGIFGLVIWICGFFRYESARYKKKDTLRHNGRRRAKTKKIWPVIIPCDGRHY
ncbi:hypothetical protein P3X46_020103 [Hevea brasiliensis]|uniref:Major facilitator superfamily (MFS) profile domain-containing protein n=1 Tax=Hevea brasiliensis TaxID=3981 RepID=A0ABQ9LM21_HEVBR|nr:hypothetical protein P3X46_020103 [Hevea brasiliensis]